MAVIDTAGQEEVTDNAPEIKEGSEIGDAIHEQANDTDPNGGATDSETPEDAGPKEGETPEEESAPVEPNLETLQAKIAELEQKLSAPPAPVQPEQPALPPISEEEWAKYEEERGIPRQAQVWFTQTIGRVIGDIQRVIDQRFAGLDRASAVEKLAQNPEFNDAKKYSKEVEQYLQKVDPRFHSNDEVLRDAVIWARGMNYKKSVQAVRNEREVNKRISGVARPSSPNGNKGSGKSVPKLTDIQKSAADAMGMDHAEYASLKGRGRIISK